MKKEELIAKIKVNLRRYQAGFDIIDVSANKINALCAPYYQQMAKGAVKEQPRCMCDDAGLTARIDFLDTLQAIDKAFKE